MSVRGPSPTPKKGVLWLHADRFACGQLRAYVPSLSLIDSGRYQPYFLNQGTDFDEHGLRLGNLKDVDLLVVQRATHPRFLEWVKEAKSRGIVTLLETDDSLFHIPKHNPVYAEWGTKDVKTLHKRLAAMVDHILVSTPPLKDDIVRNCGVPSEKVTVAYNHVHPNIWDDAELAGIPRQNNKQTLILGYQGSATHSADFGMIIEPLLRVLEMFPQVRLRFFGNVPMSIKGKIPLGRIEWMKGVPFEQYPRNLKYANFDIGLAPLVDSKFNACKSSIKASDYGCVGVPVVASRLKPYQQLITHGEDGFLASTSEEWVEALTTLILDADLRETMGRKLHETVWSKWDWKTHGPTWVNLFDQLTGVSHGDERATEVPGLDEPAQSPDPGEE